MIWRVLLPLWRAGSPPPPPGSFDVDRFSGEALQPCHAGDAAGQAGRTLGLLEELRLMHAVAEACSVIAAGASARRMALAAPDIVLLAGHALGRWRPDATEDDKNVYGGPAKKILSEADLVLTDLFHGSGIEFDYDTPEETRRSVVRSNRACLQSSRGALALEQENEIYRSAAYYMNYCPDSAAELSLYSEPVDETGMAPFPAEETAMRPAEARTEAPALIDLEAERLRRMTPGEARRHRQAAMLGRIENDYVLKLLGIF